ncbi:MAG: methyltransferase domain-containing protein [Gammaproteobacteria bacterium]|nr:methyltransferase domain-containing protein [Gammaproteobacteria bacterium]
MNKAHEISISEHERLVQEHYDKLTQGFYLQWNRDHIHLGLFEPGECPHRNENLKDSEGLERALVRMLEVIVAPARIGKHHHVVDAGCGVGGTVIHLAKTRGCTVTGINLSRLQLEMADKKVNAAGLDNLVRFEYADCSRSLPFADNSVDVVVNVESARHYGNRERFLHEVKRILKPGGKIIASDWMANEDLTANQYEKFILPLCESWVMHDLERQPTYIRLLQEAGLEVLEFDGFDGRQWDNLRIIERNYQSVRLLHLCGMGGGVVFRKLMQQMERLYDTWRSGYLVVKRYFAIKPG